MKNNREIYQLMAAIYSKYSTCTKLCKYMKIEIFLHLEQSSSHKLS